MKERPILFSAPMVRALLDGSKTQTRRVVKPSKCRYFGVPLAACELAGEVNSGEYANSIYGQPGDRLWVRETWLQTNPFTKGGLHTYGYRASDAVEFPDAVWKPSIHMPRAASRITLEITAVRVERLQDISEEDAIAEGVKWFSSGAVECPGMPETPIDAYRSLWEKINGPGSWEKNPWVWCISFKRTEP